MQIKRRSYFWNRELFVKKVTYRAVNKEKAAFAGKELPPIIPSEKVQPLYVIIQIILKKVFLSK